ncbi:hemagglutinin repeat-containing protein [Kingella negevensis]|uniref:hemagglutinin repeat-containing protein n=1 Tax=Kingella negevensis TaxID=1522312 RepID=UPI0025430192|nr:hemagglutinin repeat-containing protein [Kingella negevensis]WII93638.1 hemagglutinin repeat-containing protein [Kingella negevensis]
MARSEKPNQSARWRHYRRQVAKPFCRSVTGKRVYMDAGHDLNIVGSDIVSEQKAQLHAGHNAQLTTAQSYYNDRESHQTKKSGLMGTGGIGFTIGSKQDQFTQTSQVVQQVGSTAGSLNGDALITAGNQYSQIGSTVSTPKGRITVDAAKINIADAKNIQIGESEYVHQQKGLTIALKTPITNLAQQGIDTAKNAKQVGQSKNARVNAMAATNTAMQAFQTGKAVRKIQNGETNLKEVGISLTYGEQKNRQTSSSYHTESQASQILSGAGPAVLSATGQGKDSQINITGSDVIGKGGTALYADGAINAQAAQNTHSEHSRNTSKGWNAGVSVNLNGGSPSFGFTAGGNKGKGYTDGEQTTYRHSHIGSKEGPTVVMSGGDTNIKGAQVTGKGITVRAANLNIESLQDTADYHSRQQNIKGQVTVGYGASVSGDDSKSKINAEHRSVSEQSGLFAGDDGFDVQVGGHTHLTGGIITASQSAEEQGKNRFQSGSISQSDLHNISKYDGSSIGLGVSASVSGKTLRQEQQAGKIQLNDVARQNPSGFSSGYGRDSDHQESTTQSGIGTRHIILTNEARQLAQTGYGTDKAVQLAYTDIRIEDASKHSGSLKDRFDADKVQSELDLQRTVSQEFSQTTQQIDSTINQKIDDINAELEQLNLTPEKREELRNQRDNWQRGNVLVNMIATGLAAPTQGGVGIAVATASPAVSYAIGQHFKDLASQNANGELTTSQETAHVLAHAVLGAAVAAAGDNNALAGALSAGGAEAAAPYISKWLYNKEKGSDLTAEEKETVTAITNLLGTATGAAVGNSATDAAQGSLNAQIAVENNYISFSNKNDAMQFINIIAPSTPNLKLKVDENNRLVIDGYHYENLDGVLTLVSDETGAPIVLQGKTVFENLLISSMKNSDENKFPITDNPTLYVDSYAKMIWDPSDFDTPNMNDNAKTNKEYQHLANRLLITQPIVERLNSQNYTQNSEEFDKAETELNSILHKYRYNRLNDFLKDATPIKRKQLQGQNLTSEEHNLLQDANLAFQYHARLKTFSDNIYRKGMNVQSDILKEKFPHLKDKIISANKPDNYTKNGKVVGLISDFGAVKFIMYTNPEQNQILKTRFIIE